MMKLQVKGKLEGTARYAGLLLAPAEDLFALRAKKELFTLFVLILGNFGVK